MLFKIKAKVIFCKQLGDKYKIVIQDKDNMLQTVYSNKSYDIGQEYEFVLYNKICLII
jgi:hypothetical protein